MPNDTMTNPRHKPGMSREVLYPDMPVGYEADPEEYACPDGPWCREIPCLVERLKRLLAKVERQTKIDNYKSKEPSNG